MDEMYLGGREINKHEGKKTRGTQGGVKTKTPVLGITMKWKNRRSELRYGRDWLKNQDCQLVLCRDA